jgi:EmrB/QacA subfamily drug resistance transporter
MTSTPASPMTPYRWRWPAFAMILLADVMDLLDSTIINIAAPSVQKDIGGSLSAIQWLAAGYTLAFGICLVVSGRLGDIFGRRRLFIIGSAGFTLASTACSVAPSTSFLIVARVLQGALGAMMIPQGLGMMREMFDNEGRAKAFGMFGPIMGLSAVLGPIVAGSLISANIFNTGWRAVFLINLPLGLIALIGAIRFLPHSRPAHGASVDIVGAVIVAIASFLLIYPLVQGRELGWPVWVYVMLVASIPVLGLFAWHERRVERHGGDPIVTTSLFTKRAFNGGLLVGTFFFAGMSGLMFCFGIFLQLGLHFSPLGAGVAMIPLPLGIAVTAGVGGALAMKLGRSLMLLGFALFAAGSGLLWLALDHATAHVSAWAMTPSLLITGLGMGLVFSPFFGIVLAGVDHKEMGSASGMLNANQQLGGSLGIALVATLFFSLLSSNTSGWHATDANDVALAFIKALRDAMWLPVLLAVGAFLATFLLPKKAAAWEE